MAIFRILTPEERLRVYERVLEYVDGSVCAAIEEAVLGLYPSVFAQFEDSTDLFKGQFPEFETERRRRHRTYDNFWWDPNNAAIRKKFIQEKLIDVVKREIEKGNKG